MNCVTEFLVANGIKLKDIVVINHITGGDIENRSELPKDVGYLTAVLIRGKNGYRTDTVFTSRDEVRFAEGEEVVTREPDFGCNNDKHAIACFEDEIVDYWAEGYIDE